MKTNRMAIKSNSHSLPGIIAVVIEETNLIQNKPCTAWFVRFASELFGQFHKPEDAAQFATDKVTAYFLKTGRPIDAYNISQCVGFEKNTAYTAVDNY